MKEDLLRRDLIKLDAILERSQGAVLMCADANSRSPTWGDQIDKYDPRGRLMDDYLASNQLLLLNKNKLGPTFMKPKRDRLTGEMIEAKSYVDLTFTNDLKVASSDWRLLDYSTDHKLIQIRMNLNKKELRDPNSTRKYNLKKLNPIRFTSGIFTSRSRPCQKTGRQTKNSKDTRTNLVRRYSPR